MLVYIYIGGQLGIYAYRYDVTVGGLSEDTEIATEIDMYEGVSLNMQVNEQVGTHVVCWFVGRQITSEAGKNICTDIYASIIYIYQGTQSGRYVWRQLNGEVEKKKLKKFFFQKYILHQINFFETISALGQHWDSTGCYTMLHTTTVQGR